MPKEKFRPKESISAEIILFKLQFWPKLRAERNFALISAKIEGRKSDIRQKCPISAENFSFGVFRLSAEIPPSKKSLSAFGRNSFGRTLKKASLDYSKAEMFLLLKLIMMNV